MVHCIYLFMLNCCHPYSSYLYLIMSPTSFITYNLYCHLHLYFTYIYITSALITFIAAHVLTAHTTYILCHTVYTIFIYIYITICTYSALFYFALLVRC